MSRRILLLALSVILALLICPCLALGAEVSYVKLDDALKDVGGWSYSDDADITFKDGGITHISVSSGGGRVFGYKNAKFQNEILQFDAIFGVEGILNWQGFMIRAQNTENVPWTENNNYLVVFTEEYIELQRFNYGNRYITVKPNPVKNGERVSVEFGAINTELGVNIILNINGKTVFNEIEPASEKALTEEGYFSVYNITELSLLPYSGKDDPVPPSANMTTIETNGLVGDSVNIGYNYADIEGGTEGESEYAWYRTVVNVDHYGVSQAEPKDFRERYMEKIEGATSRTYTITEDDVGLYLRCGIRTRSKETGLLGDEVLTGSVKVDLLENILGNGIFLEKGNPYALVNGEKKRLDSISGIVPIETNEQLYVPVRFIAEALGYTVEWNGAEAVCTMIIGDKTAAVSLSDDIVISYDRIHIPIDRVFDLFGIKSSYEPLYELGLINDLTAGLDPIDYKVLLRSIKDATK